MIVWGGCLWARIENQGQCKVVWRADDQHAVEEFGRGGSILQKEVRKVNESGECLTVPDEFCCSTRWILFSGFESNNCLFSFCHLQLKISRDSLNIHLHLLKKYLPNAPGFSRESPETDVAQPCLKLVEILSKIEVGIPHTPCLLRHIEILRNSQLTGWEWVWSHTHTELIKVIDSHIFDALPSPPIPSPFFPLPSPFCLLSFLPFLFPYSPSELQ